MNKKRRFLLVYLLVSIPATLLATSWLSDKPLSVKDIVGVVLGCILSLAAVSWVAFLQEKKKPSNILK